MGLGRAISATGSTPTGRMRRLSRSRPRRKPSTCWWTDDLHPEARRVPFGEWVTITFQAVDEGRESGGREGRGGPHSHRREERRADPRPDQHLRHRLVREVRAAVPPHRSRLARRRSCHARPQHPEFGSGHQGRDGQERGGRAECWSGRTTTKNPQSFWWSSRCPITSRPIRAVDAATQ